QVLGLDDVRDVVERIRALAAFKSVPAYASLVAANKRIANILSKLKSGELPSDAEVNAEQMQHEAERQLWQALQGSESQVADHVSHGRYAEALEILAGLRAPIDQFFDDVLVMDDDPAVRHNRLALLARVRGLFQKVADISRMMVPDAA
ncbi:MAG: glycine--tRNA ligase subunit beta, partial [Magnetococcales bacterium]|nr:glycine--tRNA ligase subunit beta [Magnetococcales bacterium]